MNKRAIIKKILAKLDEELAIYVRASGAARAEATHEQSRAESKYDTRGLEASYLARGQSRQAMEIEDAIEEFRKLDAHKWSPTEPINLGALVELEQLGDRAFYFLGPRAGGTEVEHDKKEILVITPQSPLGAQLIGKKAGEEFKLQVGGEQRAAKIFSVE